MVSGVGCVDITLGSQIPSGSDASPSTRSAVAAISPNTAAPEDVILEAYNHRNLSPTPFHGAYVVRTPDGEATVSYELWVDLPAFRVEAIVGPDQTEPIVILTPDGKTFSGLDPSEGTVSIGIELSEGTLYLLGVLEAISPTFPPCSEAETIGTTELVSRPAIGIRCMEKGETSEFWFDRDTGLVLRIESPDAKPGDTGFSGFTSLEIDPDLDPGIFQAASLR
jgi:hypothetical protein